VPANVIPADLLSRGRRVNQLQLDFIWWNGPEFLQKEEYQWPQSNIERSNICDNELKRQKKNNSANQTDCTTLNLPLDSKSTGLTFVGTCRHCLGFDDLCISPIRLVAPLTSISIPRLELMAAALGLRLAVSVRQALEVSEEHLVFWSESMNVVHWSMFPQFDWLQRA
jgi:hypothetical protein